MEAAESSFFDRGSKDSTLGVSDLEGTHEAIGLFPDKLNYMAQRCLLHYLVEVILLFSIRKTPYYQLAFKMLKRSEGKCELGAS